MSIYISVLFIIIILFLIRNVHVKLLISEIQYPNSINDAGLYRCLIKAGPSVVNNYDENKHAYGIIRNIIALHI